MAFIPIVFFGLLLGALEIAFLMGWERTKAWRKAKPQILEWRMWATNQPWREPTGFKYIENLKEELQTHEAYCREALRAALGWDDVVQIHTEIRLEYFSPYTKALERYAAGEALCSKLDRLWNGNARLEIGDLKSSIQKKELRKQGVSFTPEGKSYAESLAEELIDLKRDLQDLEELVSRSKSDGSQEKFEGKKIKRRLDLQDDIFEEFECETEKEFLTALKFNDLVERVRQSPDLDSKQREKLLQRLKDRYEKQFPDSEKKPFNVYKKEA